MDGREFKERTQRLGLRVIKVVEALPQTRSAEVIGKQLLRSGTSVGANYRAACRGKSVPDVVAKLQIVVEEADETAYWLELLIQSGLVPLPLLQDLLQETDQILAMTVASIKTLHAKQAANLKSKI